MTSPLSTIEERKQKDYEVLVPVVSMTSHNGALDSETNEEVEANRTTEERLGYLESRVVDLERDKSDMISRIIELEKRMASSSQINQCDEEVVGNACGSACESERNNGNRDNGIVRRSLVTPVVGNNGAEMKSLPHDTFSFMIITPSNSLPFFLSVGVFVIQMTTFALLATNISDGGSGDNVLGIPNDVNGTVRIVQLIAILVGVITQDDLRTGLMLSDEGYDKQSLELGHPHAKKWKWILSILARLTEGSASLIVTFFLIVTEETVKDLLLNFTAVQFVSQLDEVIFFLSTQGFLGRRNSLIAMQISDILYTHRRQRRLTIHAPLLLIILTIMLAFWGVIVKAQQDGRFLCQTVFVQFDDDFESALGTFSGLYDRKKGKKRIFKEDRYYYIERRSGASMFAYCDKIGAWTFTYGDHILQTAGDSGGTIDSLDPCDWRARSSPTVTFDLTETSSLSWYARDTSKSREVQLQHFFLECFDCDEISETADGDHQCAGRGVCSNAVCTCYDGWYGLRCEFSDPCEKLEIDSRFQSFLGTRQWSTSYDILRLSSRSNKDQEIEPEDTTIRVNVYNRPVFINEYEQNSFDIIMFTGRRWVGLYSDLLHFTFDNNDDQENSRELLSEYLLNDFHGHWSNFSSSFISDPVDVGTPTDSSTPLGVGWYTALKKRTSEQCNNDIQAADLSLSMDVKLLCVFCNEDTNPCMYDGRCVDESCQCSAEGGGTLCQLPPLGNGRCDPYYNTPEFQYDGGDCCESTCVSTPAFICGLDDSGYGAQGYFHCHLPVGEWILKGTPMNGGLFTQSGFSVAISCNGAALVVGEPQVDRVNVFDKDGSEWIQRGKSLIGPEGSGFGISVSVSCHYNDIVNNRLQLAPITVAAGSASGSPTYGYGFLRGYRCVSQGCTTLELAEDLWEWEFNSEGSVAVDVSKNGKIIAAVGGCLYNHTCLSSVVVFEYRYWRWLQRNVTNITMGRPYSISLSGNGDSFAVGFDQSEWYGVVDYVVFSGQDTKLLYRWDGTSYNIMQGSEITDPIETGRLPWNPFPSFQSQSLALSTDGNILAIGLTFSTFQPGVTVFTWDDRNVRWVQRGSKIVPRHLSSADSNLGDIGDNDTLEGWSVGLSADGSIVTIGTGRSVNNRYTIEPIGLEPHINDALLGDKGAVGGIVSYKWNNSNWERLGRFVQGGAESSVALSESGLVLVVGLPYARMKEAGMVYVYEYSLDACPNGTSRIRTSFTTDNYPSETTWDIEILLAKDDAFEEEVVIEKISGGLPNDDSDPNLTFILDERCVPKNSCIRFTIYDRNDFLSGRIAGTQNSVNGYGTNNPSRYNIFVNGIEAVSDQLHGFVDRIYVGADLNNGDNENLVSSCSQFKCPSGSSQFRMLLQFFLPVSWELVLVSNSSRETQVLLANSGCDGKHWEDLCLPSHFNDTSAASGEEDRRNIGNSSDGNICSNLNLRIYRNSDYENCLQSNRNLAAMSIPPEAVDCKVFINGESIPCRAGRGDIDVLVDVLIGNCQMLPLSLSVTGEPVLPPSLETNEP